MPPPMEFGFEACRLCLAPNNIKKLTSMFAGDGDFAEMYQQLSGVDVSLFCLFLFYNLQFPIRVLRFRLINLMNAACLSVEAARMN